MPESLTRNILAGRIRNRLAKLAPAPRGQSWRSKGRGCLRGTLGGAWPEPTEFGAGARGTDPVNI